MWLALEGVTGQGRTLPQASIKGDLQRDLMLYLGENKR
jgi:hypothetical protein